ncbi:MAG: LamG domain-containing protein, partial [Pseudanabaena sp. ELA607]
VIDFSTESNDGTVYGDCYISAATLSRKLATGADAVKYSNTELFAVSERATYEESFEFKVNRATPWQLADLDNADGRNLGTKIFTFVYWGKASRSAEENKNIAPEQIKQNKFEDLGNGWFKASANVTISDGVSLLRTFEIGNIKGDWQALEIRKHRVRLVSDSITEAKYADSVTLKTLADEQIGLPAKLQQLDSKEQENAALIVEKWRLEQQLAALANLPQTEARIAQLKVEIAGLEGDQRRYQAEIDKLFNYWCTIRNVGLNTTLQVVSTVVMAIQNNPNDAAHQWRIDQVEGNWYRLENRQNGLTMMRVDPGVAQTPFSWQTIGSFVGGVRDIFAQAAQWSLDKIGDNYRIREKLFNTFELLPVGGITFCVHPYVLGTQQQWQIVSTGQPVNPSGMDATKSALEKTLANLKTKREELQRLEEVVRDGRTKEAAWKKRLAEIIALLPQIQTAINTLNNDFLEAIRKIQQKPQALSQLTKDSKGLVTQGALLGFVQSASRLNAIETCEGNVQLSYFDVQGRMRQTVYDATADSRNSAFEQWLPDAQRACLNFDKSNSWVTLNKPLILPGNWTVEAWFFYPFPETQEWNTLVRGQSIDHHILVRNRKQLGIYLQNDPLKQYFYDSGFNMELLTQGWHHITAVGRNDTTLFYMDGQQVGDTKAKALAVAQDNFNQFPNDAAIKQKLADIKKATIKSVSDIYTIANTPGGTQPFGKVAELRVWGTALTPEEIAVNSNIVLTGNEPSLLAYYPMSEATGTVVRDASGNDNGGTISNASWWGCAAPIGNPGNTVMRFDGINDSITVADNASLQVKAYTVELWIKPDGSPNEEWKGIIGKPGRNFHIWLNKAGFIHHRYRTPVSISEGIPDTPNGSIIWGQWHHIAITNDGTTAKTYINGKLSASGAVNGNLLVDNTTLYLGCNLDNGSGNYFKGQIAEVRIWKAARTETEIQANMYQRLNGKEPNLVAYYPLNEIKPEGATQKTPDLANGNHGKVNEALTTFESTLPIGADALVSAEYSNITIDPTTNRKLALMRRFFAYPTTNGAVLLPEKRIETLELKWIGNAQFAPTLLGYIEGAPPLPSENLTIEEDYNSATSVELTMSEDVEFSWNRSQDSGLGASAELFVGGDTEMNAGLGLTAKIGAMRAGFKGNFDFSYQFQNESNIASSSSQTMMDKLELRGTPEEKPKFPHLGTRFVPKNVGYALVISSLADVFITRLSRTGRMIGYQVQPVDGIPPDVNTITFLMNPAYTMNGSLDGMTGTSAASDRFFKHVPEMRSQYGSLYPASYYRLKEAYD